jgi:hypothetical protein
MGHGTVQLISGDHTIFDAHDALALGGNIRIVGIDHDRHALIEVGLGYVVVIADRLQGRRLRHHCHIGA